MLKKSKNAKKRHENIDFFKLIFLPSTEIAEKFMHKKQRIFIFCVDILKKYCIII